jgi:hypothetical protein
MLATEALAEHRLGDGEQLERCLHTVGASHATFHVASVPQ